MTGLTRISIIARKSVRYTIYAVFLILVGKLALDITIAVYKKLFPAPPPAPTVKFGQLPKIDFPDNNKFQFTYTLETPTGEFPKIQDQAKVYFMPKPSANLLALDLANKNAKALGFTDTPQQVSDTLYRYPHPKYPAVLEMNIVTGSFSISYDLNADRSPLNARPEPAALATTDAKNFLTNAGLFPEDVTTDSTHQYLKLSDGKFINALSQSEADAVQINFFRKTFDDLPSLTADPAKPNIWMILTGAQDKNQKIIAGEYHYYPVDETQYSTYPLKSVQQAFDELKAGKAYVADNGIFQNGQTVRIRKIYLAYFDPSGYSEFYQPMFVFEGGDGIDPKTNFSAYLPAVTSDYIAAE